MSDDVPIVSAVCRPLSIIEVLSLRYEWYGVLAGNQLREPVNSTQSRMSPNEIRLGVTQADLVTRSSSHWETGSLNGARGLRLRTILMITAQGEGLL
jgi:hypothetical protein